MNLYVLISDGGDGSYYPRYILDESLIEKLQEAYDNEQMYYENGIGIDGDGFHYGTIIVPNGSTAESLGISVYTEEDFKDILQGQEE